MWGTKKMKTNDSADSIIQEARELERIKMKNEIVAFLNDRAKLLSNIDRVHVRECVALVEAAIMIENGMWREQQ